MTGHTIAARAAAALVAMVAGAASYEHIASVAMAAGERPWVAFSLPVAIDGLIVVGVAALLEDRRAKLRPRPVARVAVLTGVVATLSANVASASPTWTGRLVAVAAPTSFLLAIEVLTRRGRQVAMATATEPVEVATPEPVATVTATEPVEVTPEVAVLEPVATRGGRTRADVGDTATRVAAAMAASPGASVAELARVAGVSRSTVRRWRSEPVPAT